MIRNIFCLLCVLWLVNDKACSQNLGRVDSLKHVLENIAEKDRFSALVHLAIEFVDKENESALTYIDEAEDMALLSGDSLRIVQSMRIKGQILYRLERIDEAALVFQSALSIAERRQFVREAMRILNTFGSIQLYTSRYDKALQYYFKTYEIATQQSATSYICNSLNNIGIIYYKLKDYRKALHFYKEALPVEKLSGKYSAIIPINISLCYANLHDYENAQLYLKLSLATCGAQCPDHSMVHIKYAEGYILMGLKQYKERAFLNSYDYAQRVSNTRLQLDNIYLLAEVYATQGEEEKALFYLEEGEKLINKGTTFNLEKIKIYSRFSEIYLDMKNFEKASFYQSKYISLKDSVYNENLTTNLMKAESEYLEQENKEKIAAQNEIIQLKEEVINRQGILNIVTGLLGITTFIFVFFLLRNYRKKKGLNVLLEQKIRERTGELELSRNELLSALMERDLKIRQISDGISGTLKTIGGLCYAGSKEISDPVAHSYLDRIDKTASILAACLRPVFEDKEIMVRT